MTNTFSAIVKTIGTLHLYRDVRQRYAASPRFQLTNLKTGRVTAHGSLLNPFTHKKLDKLALVSVVAGYGDIPPVPKDRSKDTYDVTQCYWFKGIALPHGLEGFVDKNEWGLFTFRMLNIPEFDPDEAVAFINGNLSLTHQGARQNGYPRTECDINRFKAP